MLGEYPLIAIDYGSCNKVNDIRINGGNTDESVIANCKADIIYDAATEAEDNLWKLVSNIDANIRNSESFRKYLKSGFSALMIYCSDAVPIVIGDKSHYNKAARMNIAFYGMLSDI